MITSRKGSSGNSGMILPDSGKSSSLRKTVSECCRNNARESVDRLHLHKKLVCCFAKSNVHIKAKHSYGIPISNAEHLGVFQWPIRGKYLRYNFQSQFPSQNWGQRFPSLVVFCDLHSNGTSPSHHLCVSLEPAYQKHQVWLIYSFLFSNSLRLNRSPEVS